MLNILPIIRGQGRAGAAMARALDYARAAEPDCAIGEVVWAARGAPLQALLPSDERIPLLFIATPSGTHAAVLAEALAAGFPWIACEKPLVVRREELVVARELPPTTALFHGYRTMWGPREIKRLLDAGTLGRVVAVEGRYWSAATARMRVQAAGTTLHNWKQDTTLNGPSDTLLDIGIHWLDLACWLHGGVPARGRGWLSYRGAPAPHRDTHGHVVLDGDDGVRLVGSFSKLAHGTTNDLTIQVIGTDGMASWCVSDPDTVRLGHGSEERLIRRQTSETGSGLAPFHGLGWTEGYVEIVRQYCRAAAGLPHRPYPTAAEQITLLERLFAWSWEYTEAPAHGVA